MSDAPQPELKLHIDSDWKEEVRREKEKLAAESRAAAAEKAAPGEADPGFGELVNLLATQAVMTLAGGALPTGEQVPPNLEASQHFINLLGTLQKKTKGNLTEDEDRQLIAVLTELRQSFARAVNPPPAGPIPPGVTPPAGPIPPGVTPPV